MKLNRSLSRRLLASSLLSALLMGAASCNSKEETSSDSYQPSSLAAVTKFTLKPMSKVAANLDSVFFSIDLNKGVVFNADSLPVGTNIEKLIPVITYSTSASAVTLTQTGGNRAEGEIDYLKNPSDTVDFSGKVTLSITAQDGTTVRKYDLKVNVHKSVPDSLMWDQLAVTPLPSRLGAPTDQKTVKFKDTSFSMIEEKDGSYTLAVATDLISGEWRLFDPNLGFKPDVRTLHASESRLFMLATDGMLYSSTDGTSWNPEGVKWTNIIGQYHNSILGLREENGKILHTSWPDAAEYGETEIESDFPVDGYSDFVIFDNRWTTLPIGIMAGGKLQDGTLTEKTWGFDGNNWAVLSQGMMPRIEGATMVPYTVYRKTSSSLVQTEFSVWMILGGRLEDDSFNGTIYTSYDNGVNWYAADSSMQLPDYMPGLAFMDGIVVDWPKSASLTGSWQSAPSRKMLPWARMKYEINDYEIYWDCPYIYLFGGTSVDNKLNDEIWRGVLARLTFIPLI